MINKLIFSTINISYFINFQEVFYIGIGQVPYYMQNQIIRL